MSSMILKVLAAEFCLMLLSWLVLAGWVGLAGGWQSTMSAANGVLSNCFAVVMDVGTSMISMAFAGR